MFAYEMTESLREDARAAAEMAAIYAADAREFQRALDQLPAGRPLMRAELARRLADARQFFADFSAQEKAALELRAAAIKALKHASRAA